MNLQYVFGIIVEVVFTFYVSHLDNFLWNIQAFHLNAISRLVCWKHALKPNWEFSAGNPISFLKVVCHSLMTISRHYFSINLLWRPFQGISRPYIWLQYQDLCSKKHALKPNLEFSAGIQFLNVVCLSMNAISRHFYETMSRPVCFKDSGDSIWLITLFGVAEYVNF